VHSLGKEVRSQQQRQTQLQARNQQIFEEIDALKEGTLAIEQRARSELGMIKEGETFYVLIEQQ
jgi:cell division protein FtsB